GSVRADSALPLNKKGFTRKRQQGKVSATKRGELDAPLRRRAVAEGRCAPDTLKACLPSPPQRPCPPAAGQRRQRLSSQAQRRHSSALPESLPIRGPLPLSPVSLRSKLIVIGLVPARPATTARLLTSPPEWLLSQRSPSATPGLPSRFFAGGEHPGESSQAGEPLRTALAGAGRPARPRHRRPYSARRERRVRAGAVAKAHGREGGLPRAELLPAVRLLRSWRLPSPALFAGTAPTLRGAVLLPFPSPLPLCGLRFCFLGRFGQHRHAHIFLSAAEEHPVLQ